MRVTRVDEQWRFSNELDSTGIYLVYSDEEWKDGYAVKTEQVTDGAVPLPMRQRWAQLHPRQLDPGWFVVRGTGPAGPAVVFLTLPQREQWAYTIGRGDYKHGWRKAAVAVALPAM